MAIDEIMPAYENMDFDIDEHTDDDVNDALEQEPPLSLDDELGSLMLYLIVETKLSRNNLDFVTTQLEKLLQLASNIEPSEDSPVNEIIASSLDPYR
jgi:hypothetical protein